MGKHKINPDYYKLKGREPQSGDVLQDLNRQQYAEARAREKRGEAPPPPRAGGAQPAAEKTPPADAAETQRFPESVLREKRNDPGDGAQPAAEETPPADAAETQRFPESVLREKRNDPGDGAQPAAEETPPADAAETQRFPESVLREKRNDPRDGAQDLEVENEAVGEGRQTSVKMGKQSSAKKMERRRHNAGPIPATSPVPGAFGRRGEKAPAEEEKE